MANPTARLKLPMKWSTRYYNPIMGRSHRWGVCVGGGRITARTWAQSHQSEYAFWCLQAPSFVSIYGLSHFDQGNKKKRKRSSGLLGNVVHRAEDR